MRHRKAASKAFDKEAGPRRASASRFNRPLAASRELGKGSGDTCEMSILRAPQAAGVGAAEAGGEESGPGGAGVNNGDVIGLCSSPPVRSQFFTVGLSGPQWRDLTTDDQTAADQVHGRIIRRVPLQDGGGDGGDRSGHRHARLSRQCKACVPICGGHAVACAGAQGSRHIGVWAASATAASLVLCTTRARRLARSRNLRATLGLGGANGSKCGRAFRLVRRGNGNKKTYKQVLAAGHTIQGRHGQGPMHRHPLAALPGTWRRV